ncbi:MAG: ABC transporter substrate-binding protein [Pirellulaceae bacterium]|nr:ABC transporter substrate-binding protein [Pirellulaceae bacterium]
MKYRRLKSRIARPRFLYSCVLVFGLLLATVFSSKAVAVDESKASPGRFETSILDDEPFDLITLTDEWNGQEVRIFPIDFPNGIQPSNPEPAVELEVKLLTYPDRLYRIYWRDIAKLETYESLILSEAKALLDARQFAPAFEHLNVLMVNYPQTAGLDQMREKFLLVSAGEMIGSVEYAHALAVLEEFLRVYPNSRRVPQMTAKISELASQMIEKYFDDGELATARLMVQRLERDYKHSPIPAVAIWKQKFIDYAETFRSKAFELRDAGNFPDARVAATRMLEIAPEIRGGQSLLQELLLVYPMVRVGVFQTSNRLDATEIADWPVRRGGNLTSQSLFAFRNTGPEGGTYQMSLGNFIHSDDRTELELRIQDATNPGVPNAYDISQWLLRRTVVTSDEYRPSWAAIMKEVSVSGPAQLTIKLNRPHVLPHAFLQWPLDELGQESSEASGFYHRGEDRGEGRISYRWSRTAKVAEGQPLEVVEAVYSDPKKAIADLVKGNIEMIDRLFPADAALLAREKTIRVESYALPMVHMLVPVGDNPFVADRDFRRALLYAVNRQAILDGEILGGARSLDSRLISGPFPFGQDENDPLSYAYNKDVLPIPYDPRLAKLLLLLTKQKLTTMATKAKEPPPELSPIRLGIPDYESAKVAGQAFIQQWALIGIPAELVVLKSDQRNDPEKPIDLLYVSAALWEPATDAERLFGKGGIAESDSIFIVQVLSNLRTARNWREVRLFCQDLHTLVSAHLPVLPLWQVSESFAYRSTILKNVPKRPVTLYQDIQKWRLNVTP